MQRDVQCCMLYSQGKVRTKDVLRFEVQTEGPDCSIQAIMQVFQISTPGAKRHAGICRLWKICLLLEEGRAGAAADCHLSRSCCYGRALGCNCQGSKKGNMRGITSHRQNTFRAEQPLSRHSRVGLSKPARVVIPIVSSRSEKAVVAEE